MAGYNRIEVGERIKRRRSIIGMTQEELAEKMGRAHKYCQDIERGTCGMSIDTMLSFASCLNISLDYMIWGREEEEDETASPALQAEQKALIDILGQCSERKKKYALDMLRLFMKASDDH